MDMVESLDRLAVDTSFRWLATWRAIWTHACEREGVDPDSLFVCLSPDNPLIPFMDIARRHYLESRDSLRYGACSGYQGLVIEGGRATIPKKPRRKKANV